MEACPADIEEIHAVRSMTMFNKYIHNYYEQNW